jgi:geranylgeranyl diphosphate synthase type I
MSAALELFDDLEDDDSRLFPTRQERALAINGACGLLIASQLCIYRLFDCVDIPNVSKVSKMCQRLLTTAMTLGGGQHLDLTREGRTDLSLDDCLEIASLKSAELLRYAFEIGATLGTNDDKVISLHALFGWHIGMRNQILNDIDGIQSIAVSKSDVTRQKATLPIAFWFRGLDGAAKQQVLQNTEAQKREEICQSGGLHFAWAVAETHRQKAAEIQAELGNLCSATSLLEFLVEANEPEWPIPG